jgi:hypothetical protein
MTAVSASDVNADIIGKTGEVSEMQIMRDVIVNIAHK